MLPKLPLFKINETVQANERDDVVKAIVTP